MSIIKMNGKEFDSRIVSLVFDANDFEVDTEHHYLVKNGVTNDGLKNGEFYYGDLHLGSFEDSVVTLESFLKDKQVNRKSFKSLEQTLRKTKFDKMFIYIPNKLDFYEVRFDGLVLRELKES